MQNPLPANPPFIWPGPRRLAGLARYADVPPVRPFLASGDLISGVLVGVGDRTIEWLRELMQVGARRRMCVVLVLFPAGPTRREHLKVLRELQASCAPADQTLEVRLLPMARGYDGDFERAILPPTVIQVHDSESGRTLVSIGSVGDAGCDEMLVGSVNFVFHPDDALRDEWRRWFEYMFSSAAPLTDDTVQIPHLVPAKGEPEAARLWEAFELACNVTSPAAVTGPTVDPTTGEVETDARGQQVVAWDKGRTALDPLARIFQQVYASGWLVTVNQATRIKPLSVPVKATLLGQQSERIIGALKQKQSFSLRVLDDRVDKAIEKCRTVADAIELLSYPLSPGNHWLPDSAKALLEKELELRNQHGKQVLREALGGKNVKEFVAGRTKALRQDLNTMYRQLGQGDTVPAEKLNTVLEEVELRLTEALDVRITPGVVYNRIAAPDLTSTAADDSWSQPLALLSRSARHLRELETDPYSPRRFTGLSFAEEDLRKACNPFSDSIVGNSDRQRASRELDALDAIMNGPGSAKEKCQAVWRLIRNGG